MSRRINLIAPLALGVAALLTATAVYAFSHDERPTAYDASTVRQAFAESGIKLSSSTSTGGGTSGAKVLSVALPESLTVYVFGPDAQVADMPSNGQRFERGNVRVFYGDESARRVDQIKHALELLKS